MRSICTLLLCLMLALALAPATPTAAQPADEPASPSYNIERIGHLGGGTAQVIVQGNYAYFGRGSDLVIVDVGTTSRPRQVGRLTLPDYVNDVVSGTRAYVADRAGGLQIIDIQNPAAPARLGSFATPDPAIGVASAAGRVFVTTTKPIGVSYPGVGVSKLYTLDIGNPAAPTVLATLQKDGYLGNPIVSGTTLYTTLSIPNIFGADSSLLAFDITGTPQPVGSANFGGGPGRLVLDGQRAYVVSYWRLGRSMLIFDLSNPRVPVLRGSFAAQISQGLGAPVANGAQVLLPSTQGLLVLDVANPDNPTLVGQLPQFFYGTAARTGNLLAFVDDSHFYLIDIASTAAARTVGTYDLLGGAALLVIDGQRAYMSNGSTRLWAVDISAPASPRELGFLDIAAYQAVPRAGYLYIASDLQGFAIADVRDPAHPRVVSRYQSGDEILNVALNGDIAYVVALGKLMIFNIHDPVHPRLLATRRDIGSNGSLLLAGTMLFTTLYNGQRPLQIYDITDATRPHLLGQYPEISNLLKVDGSSIYVTGGPNHLLRLDISDPAAPVLSIDYGLEQFTQQAVVGQYLYASAYGQGTRIFDIGTPSRVREVARDPNLYTERAIAANGLFYVSSYSEGLYVLRQRFGIRGQILDANGTPAAGVTVSAGGASALTDATGAYTITNLLPGPFTLAPAQAGFSFAPAAQPFALSADLDGQNFTRLPAPVALSLGPGQAGTLGYADTQGLRTELVIPSDALTKTAKLTLAPIIAQPGGGLSSTGHAFVLGGAPGFAAPLVATISYSDLDIQVISDEGGLALQWWNGARWQVPNCPGTINHDTAHNRLSAPICAPGAYRLVGPSNQRFLPLAAL